MFLPFSSSSSSSSTSYSSSSSHSSSFSLSSFFPSFIFYPLGVFVFSTFGLPSIHSEEITNDEILHISSMIWDSDREGLGEGDIKYNDQGPRLFEYVNEQALTGTYKLLLNLFDNYNPRLGLNETSNINEKIEVEMFLNAVLSKPPFTTLHPWLVQKGLASNDTTRFKEDLKEYWFTGYPRSNNKQEVLDSSGFEHVFLGEINQNRSSVGGFHNWLFAYKQELAGHFSYQSLVNSCPNNLISFHFKWHGNNKPISSVLIGLSPQLELSLYTLCLLTRPGKSCNVLLNGEKHTITTQITKFENSDLLISTAYVKC